MVVYTIVRTRGVKFCTELLKFSDDGLSSVKSISHRSFSSSLKTKVQLKHIKRLCILNTNLCSYRSIHMSNILYRKDYYTILGVPRDATQKDIKKAYFEVSLLYENK